jgi:hypothetical protein
MLQLQLQACFTICSFIRSGTLGRSSLSHHAIALS